MGDDIQQVIREISVAVGTIMADMKHLPKNEDLRKAVKDALGEHVEEYHRRPRRAYLHVLRILAYALVPLAAAIAGYFGAPGR